MAKNDNLKRYLDAGVAFTQMTRERAEAIVQELVDSGELRRKEAQKRIEQLVERSQKNTDELLEIVRREVAEQLKNLGLGDIAERTGLAGKDETKGAAKGGKGKGGSASPAANPTSVAAQPSETPNAADDAYPAPANETIKKAARTAASKIGAKKVVSKPASAAGGAKAGAAASKASTSAGKSSTAAGKAGAASGKAAASKATPAASKSTAKTSPSAGGATAKKTVVKKAPSTKKV